MVQDRARPMVTMAD